jgi:hypothetical protein
MKKVYIYESPDKGKTIYRREFGKDERELISKFGRKNGQTTDRDRNRG